MKIYGSVVRVTPLTSRTKKDGSGQYDYAAIDFQLFDFQNQPGVHPDYTGINALPDTVRYDGIHEHAHAVNSLNAQTGEIFVLDVAMYTNKFGNNETKVRLVERYQQPAQQPMFNSQHR